MKIIFCIQGIFNSAGMERVLINRANYLSKNYGYEILIITTEQKKRLSFYFLEKKIDTIDLEINYLDDIGKNFFKRIIQYVSKQLNHENKLKKIINNYNPDIIISLGDQEKFLIPKLKTKAKKILENHVERYAILKEQRSSLYKIKDYIFLKKEEKLIEKYDEFLVLTEEDKKQYKNEKVRVINNPLSFYPDKIAKLENKKIISIGRLLHQKGYDILIDVWNKVIKICPDWELDIYGEGDLREELQKKINKYGLEKSIFLKGREKNIQDKYLESSIYVMSSRYEGFGMVLVEAQACGLPIVSFDCPCGPKDIITDGEDGFLCKFGDIDGMAKKIIYLIKNEEKRKKFGKKARENSMRYSEEKIMNEWKELLEGLVEEK